MSLVKENVFKAVSEDEAMTQVRLLARTAPCCCLSRASGTIYLLLKKIHCKASYNVPQFTPFRLQRPLLRLLAVVSLRDPVCTTVAVTAQHVWVPRGSARIRNKRG
jgi:hypothetical protein